MEIIKEDQFRITFILVMFGYTILLTKFLVDINVPFDLTGFFKNPLNYILLIFIFFTVLMIKPFVSEVWKQVDVRDNIKKQMVIKLELQNLKLMKDLGFKFKKDKLSKEVSELIEEEQK